MPIEEEEEEEGDYEVKLTTHLHLMPRLRISGIMYLPPYIPLCCGQHNYTVLSVLPTSELRFSKHVVCVNFVSLTFIIKTLSGISDCLVLNGSLICE